MPHKRKRSTVAAVVEELPASRRVSGRIKSNASSDAALTSSRSNPIAGDLDARSGESRIVPEMKITKAIKGQGSKKPNGVQIKPEVEEDAAVLPKAGDKTKKMPTKSSLSAKKGADEIKAFKAERDAAREKTKAGMEVMDPEADGEVPEDLDTVKLEAKRSPPVNSDFLPLPWKGRLGYACLNTYLRTSSPPIFSSRTCRIASIIAHRHPLTDPSAPEHAIKNRPDVSAPADVARGQQWVEQLGVANAKDIVKMLKWNEKYGIKFLRLSSEMFPFASHAEYGYNLDFAADVLAEAGRVAAELGHRLSTHPGQFTQLGSPRPTVIDGARRDLAYHSQLLSLLRLPPQLDRDAVTVLHMGGVFGSKSETLQRFKSNYVGLPQDVKDRLVLENDDVSWSVHDLLPVCEELNIPLVLDFHHHNIIFDSSQVREGTADLVGPLMDRIIATWKRKNKTPKMHYSEPTSPAITGRQRRKHSARVRTLPPCPPDMDLMVEAKDKEQAVFELMRTFRLPGWERANAVVPYEREDDDRSMAKNTKKPKKPKSEEEEEDRVVIELHDEDVGMGGPLGRVYWPEGMEEWLVPKKREVKKKGNENAEGEVGDVS